MYLFFLKKLRRTSAYGISNEQHGKFAFNNSDVVLLVFKLE